MPTRFALLVASLRGRRTWRDTAVRARTRAAAEAITGPGPHVDRVARAHLAAHAAREELVLRPWVNARVPVHGAAHLRAAQASGRGVIVNHIHHGPFAGIAGSVAGLVPGMYVVVGSWMLVEQPDPGAHRRQQAWRWMLESQGAQLIDARGSFQQVEQLLRGGAVSGPILARPAALEDPCRGEAWEDGATAQAWLMPAR